MCPKLLRTIEVRGSNKGDVNTKVAVIGRTIKTEIDAKWNRSPCWVVLSTVEADLITTLLDNIHIPMSQKEGRNTPCWPVWS